METLFRPAAVEHDPYEGMTPKQIRAAEASRRRFDSALDRLDAYIHSCPARIKHHIDKYPLQQRTNEFFARRVKLDSEIVHQVFKRQFKVTMVQYQLQKRMEAAANLLQGGRLSYKQVVKRCGYKNANSFSRAFKKVYKQTPKQYLLTTEQQ
jgi:AraC-like DNA-binding protein